LRVCCGPAGVLLRNVLVRAERWSLAGRVGYTWIGRIVMRYGRALVEVCFYIEVCCCIGPNRAGRTTGVMCRCVRG
jgi:hypothetical protein